MTNRVLSDNRKTDLTGLRRGLSNAMILVGLIASVWAAVYHIQSVLGLCFLCIAIICSAVLAIRALRWSVAPLRASARADKKQMRTVLGWSATGLMCFAYGMLGAVGIGIHSNLNRGFDAPVYALIIYGATALMLSLALVLACMLVAAFLVGNSWDARGRLRASLLVVSVALLFGMTIYLATDDAPIENDYTIADIPAPARDVQESHAMLLTYAKGGDRKVEPAMPHLGSDELYTNALVHAREIEDGWQSIAEARSVMARLDGFEAIGDLAEPTPDTQIMSFVAYRNIAQTYWANAALLTAQGQPAEAAVHLAQLHSVFRKTLPYARTLVRKMVSVSVLCGNIRRAHALLRESDYNQEALAVLEPVFTPISHADITLRGSFVFEYVCAKRLLEELDLYTLCKLGDFDWDWRAKPGRFRRATSAMLLPVIINRNHTIRELSEIYGKMAEVADRKRDAHVNDEEMAARFGKRLRLKNIGGQLFLLRVVPSVFKACETAQRAQAMSDMLAIEIARQRGQTLDLHDCYTGREYIQDPETAAISCAGPDGEAGTTDDVALDQG